MTLHCRRRRRGDTKTRPGFMFLDVAVALGLLGIVAFAITSSVGRQQMAAQRLADTRTAARLADDALTVLRAGGPSSVEDDRQTVKLVRLRDLAPKGEAWVRAAARVGTSDAAVIGLVPEAVAPAAEEASR